MNNTNYIVWGSILPRGKAPSLYNMLLFNHLNNRFWTLSLKFYKNLILTDKKKHTVEYQTLITHANNMFYGGIIWFMADR